MAKAGKVFRDSTTKYFYRVFLEWRFWNHREIEWLEKPFYILFTTNQTSSEAERAIKEK